MFPQVKENAKERDDILCSNFKAVQSLDLLLAQSMANSIAYQSTFSSLFFCRKELLCISLHSNTELKYAQLIYQPALNVVF